MPSPSVEEPEHVCDIGVQYENSCYFLTSKFMNWTAASAECENNGSHLVTVTTAGENQFVTSLLKAHFPNGMTQVTTFDFRPSKLMR